ncbi:hypothetical protein [Tersicoccus sp. Bi-70]|uniref:hypothetical protein n=1 Tax=Tersicoccus sp. Bi-70 TaxID=1897634 RepID=UPI0009787B2C|nr:hypothetical protein [Tersicoccus sp. Bi-70]OMH36749.1 hypothetical protein BGP79_13260 [Tersicoccus sp. Bi-70]
MLRAVRVDERDMLQVDERVRPLRVLDSWLDPTDGQLLRTDSHDVETDDLAEVHAWVVRHGRTTATVSEVYRPVDGSSRADEGRFVLVGRYRLAPPTE